MLFIDYLNQTKKILEDVEKNISLIDGVSSGVDTCVKALQAGGSVFIAGNGGSAADAQHFAGELVNRFLFDRPPLRAIALTTDTSVITAIGNDYGYDEIFERQIRALGKEGDVLVAISTSGRSGNILAAMKYAKRAGIQVIGLTGNRPGDMDVLADICLSVPSDMTAHIQEIHELILHYMAAAIEKKMFGEK